MKDRSVPEPPVLEVRDLVAGYGEVNILHGVSLTVARGGFVSVIGPNGAGKSTLLKSIYGIVKPRGGTIILRSDEEERQIEGWKPHRVTKLGANYVPQLANVFGGMSVLENLEVGAAIAPKSSSARIDRVLTMFPLLRDRRRQRADTLSGGQRQMLALARALVTEPKLLFLDEPSAGLAPLAVDALFEKLTEINRAGIAILMVEQNARRSLAMSHYAYVLDMGGNRYEGTGDQLLHDPRVVELYLGGRARLAPPIASGSADET
jgi:ABC-type branched-subunit amino acid transport system ATPase component